MGNWGIYTNRIIQCVITVHQRLGPGFREKIYRRALIIELRKQGFVVEVEKSIPIYYDGHLIGRHQLDLLVNGKIIIEIKAVMALSGSDYAQVRSYLKATGLTYALLVNFSTERADYRHMSIHSHIPSKES